MMAELFNTEWLNSNSVRSYPLAEDATKQDITGSLEIPDDFLLALYFPVHAGMAVDTEKFFLRALGVFSTGYSISIGYDDGSTDPPVIATVLVASDQHQENMVYAMPGVDVPGQSDLSFSDSVGKLVVGRLHNIEKQPAGQYLFDYEGGKLDPDCIRPMIRGVSALQVVNGDEVSERFTGDIRLVAGTNMSISVATVNGEVQIRFDAIEGAGLTDECECNENLPEGPPIRRINGISPDESGNFNLIGGTCLKITPDDAGLRIDDSCAEPCCGCEELAILTEELEKLAAGVATYVGIQNRLEAEIASFNQAILGSRLHSGPCTDCP